MRESLLIDTWKPSLNYPYIIKDKSRIRNSINRIPVAWKKRRYFKLPCFHPKRPLNAREEKLARIWSHLLDLSFGGLKCMQTIWDLRDSSTPNDYLYTLWSKLRIMPNPEAFRARKQLSKVFKLKDVPAPLPARCLGIRPLPNPRAQFDVVKTIQSFAAACKSHSIPFSAFPRNPSVRKWQPIKDLLYNHRHADKPTECACAHLHGTVGLNGHKVLTGAELYQITNSRLIWENMSNGVLGDKEEWLAHTSSELSKFAKYYTVGTHHVDPATLLVKLSDTWDRHVQSFPTFFTNAAVNQLKKDLSGWILNGADHCPNQLHAYCPVLYQALLRKTFAESTDIFYKCLSTPVHTLAYLDNFFTYQRRRALSWAFRSPTRLPLPNSYLLNKPKSQFHKARCIITYDGFRYSKIQRCTGRVIEAMANIAVGLNHFDQPEVVGLVKRLFKFSKQNPSAANLVADDLSGFFPESAATRSDQHHLSDRASFRIRTQTGMEITYSASQSQ